jgi:transcriptional regulator with XRE-family HTH domain
MSNVRPKPQSSPGARVRAFRKNAGISLDDLADRIKRAGCDRPSIAKLSRIETGVQPVTIDILDGLAKATGIPARELRPDLAAKFARQGAAA